MVQTETDNQGANTLSFENIISPEHLKMITQASGGFHFMPDSNLPPHRAGYTDMNTRIIYYNPLLLQGLPELGIKPMMPQGLKGFAYHEAGHHAPEVVALDKRILDDFGNPEIIPKAYQGNLQSESRFFRAVYSHLVNGVVDIWLESFMSRRPYYPIRDAIVALQENLGTPLSLIHLSKPEQLLQILLLSRYTTLQDLSELIEQDVSEAYKRIITTRAMDVLEERRDFENYFATPLSREQAIERKFAAYKAVFLPEYLKLTENELERRKQQLKGMKLQMIGLSAGGNSDEMDAVPLTAEEEQSLILEILKQLEQAGAIFVMLTPSAEQSEAIAQKFQEIESEIQDRHKDGEKDKHKSTPTRNSNGLQDDQDEGGGIEVIQQLGAGFRDKEERQRGRGIADSLQIKESSVKRWREIKEEYRLEIESLASVLSEIFLEDRRKKLEYLKREGEVVPGLEYETIAALFSGELDPQTKMLIVQSFEFLETELEFIVDTSTSMLGTPNRKSVDFIVVVTEAFKSVKEDLAGENLLLENEEPFRIGMTKFSVSAQRITKLSEPLDDKKELIIIDKGSLVGGGTDEREAIRKVYGELSLNHHNVIKIIIILTDGDGDREGVWPILQQVEDDDEVISLAVAVGAGVQEAQNILETYLAPLRKREGNVFGIAAADVNQVLPGIVEFLKREVDKRR